MNNCNFTVSYQIKDLQQKKDRLKNQRRLVQVKLRMERDKQNHLHREEARIRREILDSADIVCTTLSGAGSTSLKQDYGRLEVDFLLTLLAYVIVFFINDSIPFPIVGASALLAVLLWTRYMIQI